MSLYIWIILEGNILGGGGPLQDPQGVWRDMYLSGVGDHFQVINVSEVHVRYCVRTYLTYGTDNRKYENKQQTKGNQ